MKLIHGQWACYLHKFTRVAAMLQRLERETIAVRSMVGKLSKIVQDQGSKLQDQSSQLELESKPLAEAERQAMEAAIKNRLEQTVRQGTNEAAAERFATEPDDFICGQHKSATGGIYKLLKVDESMALRELSKGLQAIKDEVEALGDKQVSEELNYILNEPASVKQCHNGLRDKGHEGWTVESFVKHENATNAGLSEAEVVALRLYTTSAFKQINNPLRDKARSGAGKPHPLPVTVICIINGIKKLRSLDEHSTDTVILWRGLKNCKAKDEFVKYGGTEVHVQYMFASSNS